MIDETKLNALRYTLERNGLSIVHKSNYYVCANIAAKTDNLSRYLIGKHDEDIEADIFRAYLSAADSDVVIVSDTHPITSFIVIYTPGPFVFSNFRFFMGCGLKVLFRYGFSYFGNFFKFISVSRKLRKKYTGNHSWYLSKLVSSDPDKGNQLLSVLLEWLDSNGEVVFSDGLSEVDGRYAGKYGFEVLETEKLNKNTNYYALFRKNTDKSV